MSDAPFAVSRIPAERLERMFPTLTSAQLERVGRRGKLRRIVAGEVLVKPGQGAPHFFAVRSGEVEIRRISDAGETPVAACRPGIFTGEVNMLSGRRGLLQIRVREPGEVFDLEREHLVALVQTIRTGSDLSREGLAAARWPLPRPPHLLETTLPGVFAVGDVRSGNVKRVASAVGEGSIAISMVHQVLKE
jgi:CRP-like cAMP-binding protein